MLTEAEKADCFACWDRAEPWLGREMSRTEHAAVSDEYNLRAAGVLPVMARKAAIADAANGKVKVRWSEVGDRAQWSKAALRQSTPDEIERQRQAFARRAGVDPAAVPYLVAQARAAGFGKPEEGDEIALRPPGYHQFNLSDVCVHCGVTRRKVAERGGACRFVAEPASPVHVEPSLGRALRKVREFDVMLGAVRWMAPK